MDQAPLEQQTSERPIFNIVGENIWLGPLPHELVALSARWDNDVSLTILSGDPLRPKSREAVEAEYQRYSRGDQDNLVGFSMYEATTSRQIGVTHLRDIDGTHRTAEFGIFIGEKDCWGKGYGTEATRLMLDYGLTVLGLHNVMLTAYSFNERAMRAYQRAGFRIMGRRRAGPRAGGHAYDVVYMDCLASAFTSPLPPIVAEPG
jgi:diamine N-acetyltransferase